MRRELLFFLAGLTLTALTGFAILKGISFLAEVTKNSLSATPAEATSATHFDIPGLKSLGILPPDY